MGAFMGAEDRVARIRARLTEALGPSALEIIDDSALHAGHAGAAGGGGHYRVRIVSARFAGQSPIERHRAVYHALGDLMGGEVHALSLRALAPDED
jgi:BolA family transcriptional regulator, general stress-responsive regulator